MQKTILGQNKTGIYRSPTNFAIIWQNSKIQNGAAELLPLVKNRKSGKQIIDTVITAKADLIIMQYTDPVFLLQQLIRCRSVTPDEGGALSFLQGCVETMGFVVDRPVFSDHDTPDIENLYAKRGNTGPHLMFAGHTDVVPPGDAAKWSHFPFAGDIADGVVYGRGAVDMKGSIACFLAALARIIQKKTNQWHSITSDNRR